MSEGPWTYKRDIIPGPGDVSVSQLPWELWAAIKVICPGSIPVTSLALKN